VEKETRIKKVLTVILLSLALMVFVLIALVQIRNTEDSSIKTPIQNAPPMSVEYNTNEKQMPEEVSVSEVFEREGVSSENDLFLLEDESIIIEDFDFDQDVEAMEGDMDFMFSQ
jgi:uncharacterized membrane protein YkgB